MTRPLHIALAGLLCSLLAPASARAKRGDPPSFKPPPLARAGTPKPVWPRRRRPVRMRAKGIELTDIKRWPAEPPSPETIDRARLAGALRAICGWMPPKRSRLYASWLVEHGRTFGVDPFLLAGLMYRQSLCLPNSKNDYGIGLTGINPRMHAGHIRRRRYRYYVLVDKRWVRRELAMPKYLFFARGLRISKTNLYFAAALVSMWQKQCRFIDRAFGSVAHRHSISHFVWGDRVRGTGAEDRVLTARRRLLQYYRQGKDKGLPADPRAKQGELVLAPPLDATPRVVTSAMGDDRSDGARRHKGIDFASTYGEPVRAVADGLVIIAGIDQKVGPTRNVPPEKIDTIKSKRLGAGGLYVMIRHAGGLRSAYMHLSRYRVRAGQRVKAGQIIGAVGRSGIKISSAHLHFELRDKHSKHLDPVPAMRPYIFTPDQTWAGRRNAWEQKRVRSPAPSRSRHR